MTKLDLNLLPLYRHSGQEQTMLPGVHAAVPPQRAARGREAARLVIFFAMSGNAPLPLDQQKLWLDRLAQVFYRTPGSQTAALRVCADTLNKYLFDRNLRGGGDAASGRQGVGALALAALRDNRLTLALSSPAQAWQLSTHGVELFFDDERGRGLGLSKNAPLRFFQCELSANMTVLLAPQATDGWTHEALAGAGILSLDTLRRRLLSLAQGDFSAVLLQASTGNGKLRWLTPRAGSQPAAAESGSAPEAAAPPPVPAVAAAPALDESVPAANTLIQPASQPPTVEARPAPPPLLRLNDAPPAVKVETLPVAPAAAAEKPRPAQPAPAAETPKPALRMTLPRLPRLSPGPLGRALGVVGGAFAFAGRQAGKAVAALLRRVLPDESLFALSPSTMVFFAVAIPLVLAVVGSMVYLNRGQAQQFEKYLGVAQQAAERAAGLTDPAALRAAWLETVVNLDKAEEYRSGNADAMALRQQAMSALDSLEGVRRLAFSPAIYGGLGVERQITRMAASGDDLYLLDGAQGLVMLAFQTGRGYELDTSFRCAPGSYGGLTVGPLVDFVTLPAGMDNRATVLGLDANGVGLYCIPGAQPLGKPFSLPTSGWKAPSRMAQDGENLYVLDAGANAVWVYWGLDISQAPALYFNNPPQKMSDVIDLAIFERRELFLLHADGQVTECNLGYTADEVSDCQDPMLFNDPRPGRQSGATIPETQFNALRYVPPPESSLFFFDPTHQAVYQFSRQLNLHYQFRPQAPLGAGGGSAFAVSADRLLFMAVGHEVFFANLP